MPEEVIETQAGQENQPQEGQNPDATQPNKPTEIDWSTVDVSQIPADVIKKTTAYKDVLTESIQRRQTISSLKDMLEEKKPDDNPKNPVPNNGNDATDDQDDSRLARLERMVSSLVKDSDTENRIRAAKAAGFDDSQASYLAGRLTGDTYDEYVADAKKFAEFMPPKTEGSNKGGGSTLSPNNPAPGGKDDSMKARLAAQVRALNNADSNPFTPGAAAQAGGGVFISKK